MAKNTRRKFRLSGFFDEHRRFIDDQIADAVEYGSAMDVRFISFDPKDDEGENIFVLDDAKVDRLAAKLKAARRKVTQVGSPIGKKIPTINDGSGKEQDFDRVLREQYEPFFARMCRLQPSFIRVFGGNLAERGLAASVLSQVIDQMGKLAELAAKYDHILVLENEMGTAAHNTATALAVVEAVDLPSLGLALDPGNEWGSGTLDPEVQRAVAAAAVKRAYVFHGKDLCSTDPKLRPGEWTLEKELTMFRNPEGPYVEAFLAGLQQRAEAIYALLGDDDCGCYSIEPHMAHSDWLSGRTRKPEQDAAMRHAHKLLTAAGVDPAVEATPFWNQAA